MTTSARDLAIRDAYAAGASLRTIGAQQGLSHEAVRKVLRRLAKPERPAVPASRAAVIALARAWPGAAAMEGAS